MRFCYLFLDSWEVNLAMKAEVGFAMSPACCYEYCQQQAEMGGIKSVT